MKALFVIDMQYDFVYGPLGSQEAINTIPIIQKELETADEIIFTHDTHKKNYLNTLEGHYLPVEHCIDGTAGWEVIPELHKWYLPSIKLRKSTFGTFELKNFAYDETDEIRIVGVCTDICIISSALILRAANPNVKITIVANGCAGTTPEAHEAALKVAKSCQIEVEYV